MNISACYRPFGGRQEQKSSLHSDHRFERQPANHQPTTYVKQTAKIISDSPIFWSYWGSRANDDSLLRLVSAVLIELSEDWETGKVYLNIETE